MKTVLLALSLLASAAFSVDVSEVLEIGSKAPLADQKMMDVSGNELSLDDIKKEILKNL